MKSFSVRDVLEASKGRLTGTGDMDCPIGEIVIDSRRVQRGDLFAAFRGEKTDGHDYIPLAFEKGAACCLAERAPENPGGPVILTDDVQKALENIAAAYRKLFDIPVIGIAGSVGKTTAKEMIWSVLSRRMNVLKTEGNFNNQIGVPMTLSRLEKEHEAAVVEMGISGFGEMSLLARMARPTMVLFTTIGHAHLEFLHDLDGVLKAKTEVLKYLPKDGTVIINGDDEKLRTISCPQKIISYGFGADCDIRAENAETLENGSTACDIVIGKSRFHIMSPAYGQHMIYAALEGAAVGHVMGLDNEEIARGIAAYRTVGHRGAVTDTGHIRLIDDCYNSNPDSLKCAIDSLTGMGGRRVCILGDMLEQGEGGAELHFDIGRYAREKGVDFLIGCGPLAENFCRGMGKNSVHFSDRSQLMEALPELIRDGDTVLVKASLGMHLEPVAEALKKL
ncbi:MAG: UDP-N-acetylmuramoyl-tripeptide--D-alanyl-D-alanine ligase [Candidatus Limivicinus sp.]